MARSISCPNCGSVFELVNPGIVMLVCDHCGTRLYLSDEAAEAIGEQSILPQDDSRLYLGATGTLNKHSFVSVGHIRYTHDDGFWDEWYLELSNGKYMWLIEDERDLSLEIATRKKDIPRPNKLLTGQPAIRVKGHAYLAQFKGEAICQGGAGQLPFIAESGKKIAWADLASLDGKRVGTIEQPEGGKAKLYLGLPIAHSSLYVNEQAASSKARSRSQAMEVQCPNCGAPLSMPQGREVKTIVCEYCGTQADLSGAQAKVMGINPKGLDPDFSLEIGTVGKLGDVSWAVSGRLLLSNTDTSQEHLQRRYLLHNPEKEPLWLMQDGGHFYLVESTEKQPVLDPLLLDKPRTPVQIGTDEVYRFAEAGESRVLWVDGALPWRLAVGNSFVWANLVAPPRIFLVESSGAALRCYTGKYTPAQEIVDSFDFETLPQEPTGVHPAQPFDPGPLARGLAWVGGVFLLLNLILWTMAWIGDGDLLWHKRLSPAEYATDDVQSPPLFVSKPGVLSLRISAAVLHDDELQVLVGLVDKDGKIVQQDHLNLSGSQEPDLFDVMMERRGASTRHLLPSVPPGSYRMIVRVNNDTQARFVTVEARQGVWYAKYFLFVAALAGFFPLMLLVEFGWFDLQKWRGAGVGGYGARDERMARIIEQVRIARKPNVKDKNTDQKKGGEKA